MFIHVSKYNRDSSISLNSFSIENFRSAINKVLILVSNWTTVENKIEIKIKNKIKFKKSFTQCVMEK